MMEEDPKKFDEEQKRLRKEAYLATMRTAAGRRVLYDIIAKAAPMQTIGPVGHETVYFQLGIKAIGLTLMADLLEYCPAEYHVMLAESHTDANTRIEAINRLETMTQTIATFIHGG